MAVFLKNWRSCQSAKTKAALITWNRFLAKICSLLSALEVLGFEFECSHEVLALAPLVGNAGNAGITWRLSCPPVSRPCRSHNFNNDSYTFVA